MTENLFEHFANHKEPVVKQAYEVARAAHKNQVRGFKEQGVLYITHLVRVARAVEQVTDTHPNMVAAALLHDVVEDTPITIHGLQAMFGPAVADTINKLTHWKELGQTFTQYIVNMSHDPWAMKIKIEDIRDNLKTMPDTGSLRDKHEFALIYLLEKLKP